MAMWVNEIRMVAGIKNLTITPIKDKVSKHKQGPQPVKVNKWIARLKTEAGGHKIIIARDLIVVVEQVALAVEGEEEEGS